jgi:hypothetical protein
MTPKRAVCHAHLYRCWAAEFSVGAGSAVHPTSVPRRIGKGSRHASNLKVPLNKIPLNEGSASSDQDFQRKGTFAFFSLACNLIPSIFVSMLA